MFNENVTKILIFCFWGLTSAFRANVNQGIFYYLTGNAIMELIKNHSLAYK